ncbi:MAG: hypothetical protein JRI68_15285, partial [Deltaproteobacteria bacterium]|nr:hypothetical protein [Deltaproteobacteria bacterium]
CDLQVTGSVVRVVGPEPEAEAGGLGLVFGSRFYHTAIPGLIDGGSLEVTDSLVNQAHEVGILLVSGTGSVTHSHVVETLPRPGGFFGDGLSALSMLAPGSLVVRDCLVEDNARAGIGSFSAQVTVGSTQLSCNAFALAGQSPTPSSPFEFVDEGDNRCACNDQEEDCKVLTPGLAPPQPPIIDG